MHNGLIHFPIIATAQQFQGGRDGEERPPDIVRQGFHHVKNLLVEANIERFGLPIPLMGLEFFNAMGNPHFHLRQSKGPKQVIIGRRSNSMGSGNRDIGEERADGTGLGLYLIHKVIQKLGGEIWYEAKENGSNFVFILPLKSESFLKNPSLPIGARLQMAPFE